ncbi:MAG: molybdenum cofactor guanylyltransferase [candidate division Zixibacteria bacterium]|nr:molybdenum cofactor guanylyltransferase [candidate division Zixibacteria bacterium]MDH3936789.1 molybdenum cofactor guanylyltransferase [candidate division Zixibacteria bacterium]MDH4032436.1 molybdenum cofactor guanylyltransferase [candidate division Zixibacteria bacterium]
MIDTVYILAGGQSRRMGQDKLLMECDGLSFLSRTVQTCRPVFSEVKLVAKQPGKFGQFENEIIYDWPHADGPLAGVVAALEDCRQECCFVTAADLYDLDSEIFGRLIKSYHGEQYFGLLETNGIQPLCGIYHRSALPYLVSQGRAGERCMRKIIAGLDHDMLPVDRRQWRNINRPGDLMAIGDNNG